MQLRDQVSYSRCNLARNTLWNATWQGEYRMQQSTPSLWYRLSQVPPSSLPCHVLTERNSPSTNVHSGNPVVKEQDVYSNSFNLHASCWRNNHLYWTYTLELPRLNPQQLQLSLLGNPAICFLRRCQTTWPSVI